MRLWGFKLYPQCCTNADQCSVGITFCGWPKSTTNPGGFCVLSSTGVRPLGTTVEKGFGMNGGRPVGTTAKKVCERVYWV